jgi:hypothetical protein
MSRKHQFILFVTAILQIATVVIIVSKSWVGRPQITRIDGEIAYEVNATSDFHKPICTILAGISVIQHGLWLRYHGVTRTIKVVIECSDGWVKGIWRPADGELKVGSGLEATSIKTPRFATNTKPAPFEFEAQAADGYVGDESMQSYRDFAESTAAVIEADCHDPYWGSADVQCQVDLRDFGPKTCENAALYAGYQALARLVAEGLPTYGVVDILSRCADGRAELQVRNGVADISLMPDNGPESYREISLRYLDPLVFDPNLKEHPLFVAEPESYDCFETEVIPEKPRDYVAETQARQAAIMWLRRGVEDFDRCKLCFQKSRSVRRRRAQNSWPRGMPSPRTWHESRVGHVF